MYTKETSFSRRMKQAEQHAASLLQQILIFVLIFLVIFMMVQIQNLHGTAHVVNYAGLVRGATQREVKLEITGTADDMQIEYLDKILSGLKYEDGKWQYTTIGGEKPVGLCGSGLIDLVAELLRVGLLDENGILHSGQERSDTFMLVPSQETVFAQCEQNMSEDAQSEKTECLQRNEKNGSGQSRFENDCGVYLTQKDIGEVQLAKAAIAAGIQLLLKKRSIEESQIQTVYLAGGFGNYMSAENAARIGLIPESFVKKVQCVGNIAGEGAKIALLNKNERHEIENAVRNMEFLELAACPEFQDCFVDELGFER